MSSAGLDRQSRHDVAGRSPGPGRWPSRRVVRVEPIERRRRRLGQAVLLEVDVLAAVPGVGPDGVGDSVRRRPGRCGRPGSRSLAPFASVKAPAAGLKVVSEMRKLGAEGLAAVVAHRAEDVEVPTPSGSRRVSYQITVTWPWASTARLGRAWPSEHFLGNCWEAVEPRVIGRCCRRSGPTGTRRSRLAGRLARFVVSLPTWNWSSQVWP